MRKSNLKENISKDEQKQIERAIGRLFYLMSKPYEDDDEEQYEKCKNTIMILGAKEY